MGLWWLGFLAGRCCVKDISGSLTTRPDDLQYRPVPACTHIGRGMPGIPGMLGIPRPAPGIAPMFGRPMFGIPGRAGMEGRPGRPPGRSPAASKGFSIGGRMPARSAAAFRAGAAAALGAAGLAAGVAAGAAFFRGLSVSTKSCKRHQQASYQRQSGPTGEAVLLAELFWLDVENARPTDHYETQHPAQWTQ